MYTENDPLNGVREKMEFHPTGGLITQGATTTTNESVESVVGAIHNINMRQFNICDHGPTYDILFEKYQIFPW